ncbi:ubiquitin carboxyl-terminal hydrolase [Moelleriella libera RCEF 2490]|uniref:Ubiquitin carboxyl-terminal hydrolase n=1 Tax=Moelleriella libera RCEF 2490 TaxID=1081109 RepID=A0A166UN75_9HYPO|nr:ubiquitin carboxyl-terminal hydrolase [Moelleriella libera RCEF 2490]
MPDKASSVVSYAAGASLAAVALIYVFGPTFAIDHDASSSSKKKTVVGLRNQANDCFINSVLQVLAGLGDLRVYLIRETHRRRIADPAVYANLVQPHGTAKLEQWKLQGLQDGLVTQGLKEMLDALNERPIYKKSISPFPLVRVLEAAFKQRISRQQQDAQEFLQILAERLKDEYHAGQRARFQARKNGLLSPSVTPDGISANGGGTNGSSGTYRDSSEPITSALGPRLADCRGAINGSHQNSLDTAAATEEKDGMGEEGKEEEEEEEGFPMEGMYESQIECQTCKYRTKPRQETFCTLTLAVPQLPSTTLSSCFDGVFKTEFIDDFKCEMCRLLHVKANLEREMAASTSESFAAQAKHQIGRLQTAIDTDPEKPPKDVDLGDIKYAPKRRIAKTTRISFFPKILAIHLSRSIYGIGQTTQKNFAKVAFPEELPLGGLAKQRQYKLLGVVTHRGGHNSGHYEAFRRQNQPLAYHNSNTFQPSDVYSRTSTPTSVPEIEGPRPGAAASLSPSPAVSTPDVLSPSPSPAGFGSSTPSLVSLSTTTAAAAAAAAAAPPRSVPAEQQQQQQQQPKSDSSSQRDKDADAGSLRSVAASTRSALSRKLAVPSASRKTRRRKHSADKWWRVSDEKVREAKTGELLGMQREVYLLFYELDR